MSDNEAGARVLARERHEQNRLIGCMLCGRGGGQLRAGATICEACRKRFCPTPLQLALDALGVSVREVADRAGVSTRTVLRASRGDAVSAEARRAIAKATGLRTEEV